MKYACHGREVEEVVEVVVVVEVEEEVVVVVVVVVVVAVVAAAARRACTWSVPIFERVPGWVSGSASDSNTRVLTSRSLRVGASVI